MHRVVVLALLALGVGCQTPAAPRVTIVATPLVVARGAGVTPGAYAKGEASVSFAQLVTPQPSLALDFSAEVDDEVQHSSFPGPLQELHCQVVDAPSRAFVMTAYMEGCEPVVWRYTPSERRVVLLTLVFQPSD